MKIRDVIGIAQTPEATKQLFKQQINQILLKKNPALK
jgi:hypothetical protein